MPHISEPLLQAYIDGFCSDARVAEVEAHVADCSDCSARLEQVRGAAERASQLLGALEPGPVHAPSFEELKERALARSADTGRVGVDAAAALELARAATAGVSKQRTPLWRRPALAWAATVVIAFGIGWFTRSGLELPAVPQTAASRAPEPDSRFAEQAAASREGGELVGGEVAGAGAPAEEVPRQEVFEAEPDDAARNATADNAAAAPAQAEPPSADARTAPGAGTPVPDREAALRRMAAQTPAEERRPAVSEQESITVAAASPLVDVNEKLASVAFRDAALEDFFEIDRADVELWLGARPRELPGMELVRAEAGPAALLYSSMAGLAAVRLTFAGPGGDQVELLQVYTGSGGDRLSQVGALAAGRPAPADAPARAERARSSDELRVDRDAASSLGTDLPALVQDPDTGTATYTWIDADGYLLSITARREPGIVRGLADQVR